MGSVPGRGWGHMLQSWAESAARSLRPGDAGHCLVKGAALSEQAKGPVILISCHKPRSVLRAAQYDMASGAVGKFNVVQVSTASWLHCDAVQGWEPACLADMFRPG